MSPWRTTNCHTHRVGPTRSSWTVLLSLSTSSELSIQCIMPNHTVLLYFFRFEYKKQFIAILIWDVRGGYRLQIYPRSYATRYMGFPIFPKLTSLSSARFRCYCLFWQKSCNTVQVLLGSWIVFLASLRVVLPVLTEFPLYIDLSDVCLLLWVYPRLFCSDYAD